jgi:hypothetical protein
MKEIRPMVLCIDVWQGVAMDSLKYCYGLLWPVMPDPSTSCGPLAGRVACGCLLALWTPHAVRLWCCHTESFLRIFVAFT